MSTPARSAALRKGRVSEPDRVYHIVATTLDRRCIFADLYAARVLIRAMQAEQHSGRARTIAFVVMPDHLHWLLELGEARLCDLVGAVKSVTAHRLGQPVWQDGFFDHALRRDEDLRVVARYIVANPIRAGLVRELGSYPHWDAIWL